MPHGNNEVVDISTDNCMIFSCTRYSLSFFVNERNNVVEFNLKTKRSAYQDTKRMEGTLLVFFFF